MSRLAKAATTILAGAMLALQMEAPGLAARPTPTFAVEYDGLGRKKLPPVHPKHNAKRRTKEWREYAARVVATHSDRPDPRAAKYLHAHARQQRWLAGSLAA